MNVALLGVDEKDLEAEEVELRMGGAGVDAMSTEPAYQGRENRSA